ncbi:dipeptidyl peptidase 2 isoform X1 [Parasteatoda tepidariorum]|uniref:dipeptidyl peptidase 2 isoform X1 n=1 Tax=Parasteatoda tepidariorum TaxID=114398 RepID=UPI001C718931|nr:dipeptidyl peptidase 2 isoform X1 [Parasteatoda tepidariorum]
MAVLYILFLISLLAASSNCSNYVEDYFDQQIDHFNFESNSNQTFKQRFLYNDTWWDRGRGPIFFYAGNEGDIVGFWENTGYMFKIAPQFQALVVFVEHRYYGKSLPFGQDSFQPKSIGLLSIQQALADYAFFLKSYKKKLNADDCPVIAFGGSYGGMLAAYMKFKYPNIITGAIAASAPIYQVAGKLSGDIFFQAVTKDFQKEPGCENQVRAAFGQIQKWAAEGASGLRDISRAFHLCKPLADNKDYDHFLRWIRNSFVSAAMMDYPYPATFMGNFPAFPVKVMCSRLLNATRPVDGLYSAAALYYNASNPPVPCFDIYQEYIYCADPTGCGLGSDSKAWDYQACTEINLEGNTNGINDMFPALPFNSTMRDDYCLKAWNVLPRRNWLDVLYWGEDIASSSNIVFSNGNLDPWAPGGVLQDISDTLVTVLVDGGAHHLDLRADNPLDPPSVVAARSFETRNIQKWLHDYYGKH